MWSLGSQCSRGLPKELEECLFLEFWQRNVKIPQLWIKIEPPKEKNNGHI